MQPQPAGSILSSPRDAGAEDCLSPTPQNPPGFEEIQRKELARLFGLMGRARLVFLPAMFSFLGWLAFTDQTRWRQAFLLAFIPGAAAFVWAEWKRYRREGFTQGTVERNLTVAALGEVVVAGASGGLESPIMPLAVVFSLFVGLFVSRRLSYVLLLAQLAGLWTLAWLALATPVQDLNPAAFGGGPRAGHPPALLWATALLFSFFLAVARGVGRIIRKMFDAMLRRALAAQEDVRIGHAERSEELTALAAEIAHELKNPLASVKGLAGLLETGIAPGKAAERLGVLRREVDRMQGILDEFLNFSRPLVPLALGRVDLAAVAREVAALHEGLGRERGVTVEVHAAPATVRCDPRKVKQLLINLVQNAIEASQPGGAVELETATAGGGARVRVLDRGRGPDPSLGERLFEAGVTTKARGSGLGLPIARQLARQHGGELTLAPRPGGGAVAELALPSAPPEGHGQAGEAA